MLKVEGKFHFALEKLEQKLKFDMDTKESRSIPVSFNCDLIKASKTEKSFHGKIKAYSLGKLQGTVNLHGNLCYPSVEISSSDINVVTNMQPHSFNLILTNNSEVDADFKLIFKESETLIDLIRERKQEKLMNVTQCIMKQKCNLRETFFMSDSHEIEAENILNEVVEDENDFQAVSDQVFVLHALKGTDVVESKSKLKRRTPTTKEKKMNHEDKKAVKSSRPEVEITLKEIQKHFKHLTRGLSEVFYRKEKKIEDKVSGKIVNENCEKSAEKLLKLSQTRGRLKPSESRMVSVLFKGDKKCCEEM